ncbi:hypothetical protein [Colwellia echini]|uniref:Lipoprotein n=1 Tax=Colwellia echini TaxID=1982103 RepID=A0ABY3MV42_9GAMM|nr:hypothetical protein [Colwellia echini]TYK64962.1 hypothetical protein CWS31_012605 [Colwellia echini]
MMTLSNKKLFKVTAIAAAISLLTACGGSDSVKDAADVIEDKIDDLIDENKTLEGTFIDSAVAGINYECGDNSGVTDAEGKFDYKLGDACTFKLGDLELGSIANMTVESPIVTPFDIAEDSEKAIKIASLLQTIDADGNPENGIDLTSFDSTKLTADILNLNGNDFYQEVWQVTGVEAVTFEAAQKHMEQSLAQSKGYHSTAIEDVISKVEAVDNVEQLDIESFLAEINTILATDDGSNKNDINALKAIFSIVEILNDPRVQNRITLSNDSGYTAFLPQIIDASLNASDAMLKASTGSTEDISGLFFEMSTRLAAASDTLGQSFEDPNYVANYGAKANLNLTAEAAYAIQAIALGYSSVLSYFSAYNYASDSYYLPQSFAKELDVIDYSYVYDVQLQEYIEEYSASTINAEAEYTTAEISPDLLYKDDNFGRLHSDPKYLTLAKTSLIKIVEIGKKEYSLNNDDTTAEQEKNIAIIDAFLANLNAEDGSKSPIDLADYSNTVEGKVNLQAFYSPETALDRDDFNISASIDCGDLTYSEDYSKLMGSPMCSSGTYVDGEPVDWDSRTTLDYSNNDAGYSATMIYAVPAEINIDIEPKSEAVLDNFILECTEIDDNAVKSDCVIID